MEPSQPPEPVYDLLRHLGPPRRTGLLLLGPPLAPRLLLFLPRLVLPPPLWCVLPRPSCSSLSRRG